jgi:hypothetical protein
VRLLRLARAALAGADDAHIVTDGWSSGVLTRANRAVHGYRQHEPSPLPLPVQYATLDLAEGVVEGRDARLLLAYREAR